MKRLLVLCLLAACGSQGALPDGAVAAGGSSSAAPVGQLTATGSTSAAPPHRYKLGGSVSPQGGTITSMTFSPPLSGGTCTGGACTGGLTPCTNGQIYEVVTGAWACVTPAAGSVTSIAAGTGLNASPSPITGSGTLSIANTAVAAGSYTLTNLTVNAQGQLTAASSYGGSTPSACPSGAITTQPTLSPLGVVTNNCTNLVGVANASGSGSVVHFLRGDGSWVNAVTSLTFSAPLTGGTITTSGSVGMSLSGNLRVSGSSLDLSTTVSMPGWLTVGELDGTVDSQTLAAGSGITLTPSSTATVELLTCNASGSTITGMPTGTRARVLDIEDVGNSCTFTPSLTISTPGGVSFTLQGGAGATAVYDPVTSTWQVTPRSISGLQAGGTGTLTVTGTNGLLTVDMNTTGVSAGSYTNANITVNAEGQITAASNGTAAGITGTLTSTHIPVASGTSTLTNSNVIESSGTLQLGTSAVEITESDGQVLLNSAATPAQDQLVLKANGLGVLSLYNYSAGNNGIGFDDELSGGVHVARATSTSGIINFGGTLIFYGDAGKTVNVSYTPTQRMTLNESTGALTLLTGGLTVGNANIQQNGNIAGITVTADIETLNGFTADSTLIVHHPSTGQTASLASVLADNAGTYNTTAAALVATVGSFTATSTRNAGANNLTDRAIYATASGGQVNEAIHTDDGDNVFNATSGGSTFDRNLSVLGTTTLTGQYTYLGRQVFVRGSGACSTGSCTYTPTTGTRVIRIRECGAGGGGGGGKGGGAGGGAAGQYIETTLTSGTGFTGGTVTIGAGGTGGTTTPTNGSPGGNTSVVVSATTYTADGGGGGTLSSSGPPVLGGFTNTSATVADISTPGSPGGWGAQISTDYVSGVGGSSQFGAGGNSVLVSTSSSANGNDGVGYCSGGSGAAGTDAGGNGAPGIVIIDEYM